MIALLAPSKTMSFDSVTDAPETVIQPVFLESVKTIVSELQTHTTESLSSLMKVNPTLAEATLDQYVHFSFGKEPIRTKPALLAYTGDTYKGLDAGSLTRDELRYAETTLRILSGLYGIVSPLTQIEPYRLEMGLKLNCSGNKPMARFWRDSVTGYLNELLLGSDSSALIDLASAEYMAAIDKKAINGTVIDVVFLENRNGKHTSVAVYSKRARGMMARFIVKERVQTPEDLCRFSDGGYRFDGASSDNQKLVFIRNSDK